MKFLQTIVTLGCALFTANLAHSAILTVDNKPGAVAMFPSFQAAYNAAQAGDTVMLAGSPTAYSAPPIFKSLHIVGPGYLFSQNQIPGVNASPAYINLSFHKDSQIGDASGSSVSGVSGDITSSSVAYSVPVVITRCEVGRWILGAGSSVSGSILYSASGWGFINGSTSVRNCLILGSINADGTNNTISNCVTIGGVSGQESTSWSNVIFVNSGYTTTTFATAVKGSVTHSMAVGNSILSDGRVSFLPTGGGNINGLNLADVFVSSGNSETRWMLKSGSPAIGSGFNGVDMGAFGGPNPYRLSGVAPRPRITRLVIPAAATDATGLQFEVDAKAF